MPPTDRARRWTRRAVVVGTLGAAAAAGTAGVVLRQTAAPGDDLDTFDPTAADFFGRFSYASALEIENYTSLGEMSVAATAVVVARVDEVVATRTILGDGGDRLGMIGLSLRPLVVKGALQPTFADRLVVEFVGGSGPVQATVADLRRTLSRASAVWFLRAKAERIDRRLAEIRALGRRPSPAELALIEADRRLFRLVSSQGFFIQGQGRIENPMTSQDATEPESRLRRVAEEIPTLSALVAAVKEAR